MSLREIVAASGATNASAVQYHFGGRRGLVKAVLDKHEPTIHTVRHKLLDEYDGGLGYLQLVADLYNRPNPTFEPQPTNDPPTASTAGAPP